MIAAALAQQMFPPDRCRVRGGGHQPLGLQRLFQLHRSAQGHELLPADGEPYQTSASGAAGLYICSGAVPGAGAPLRQRRCPVYRFCRQGARRLWIQPQIFQQFHRGHAPPGQLVFHRPLIGRAAPEQYHRSTVLRYHDGRVPGAAHKINVDDIPGQGISHPDGCRRHQQKTRQCSPQTDFPVQCQAAQHKEEQTDRRCIPGIKIKAGTRFCADPHCPGVEPAGQEGCRLGDHAIDRFQRRDRSRKCRAQPQQHHGLHHPQDSHTGYHCIQADAQSAQDQHRERGGGRTERNAQRLTQAPSKTCRSAPQNARLSVFLLLCPLLLSCCRPDASEHFRSGQCSQYRRKGQFKSDVTYRITVADGHGDPRRRQRSERVRCSIHPHTQRTDPDRCSRTAHRRGKPGHTHQQKCQNGGPDCFEPSAPVAALPSAARQKRREKITAQDGYVHSADHQHMGKPCTPVGAAQICRKIIPVAHGHRRQHTAGGAVHAAAQGCAEPLLQPPRPGTETLALSQHGKVLLQFCTQRNAVRIAGNALLRFRR